MTSVMNDEDKRRRFFYAMNDAGMYDATIEWVAPHYRLMHQMLLRLVRESLTEGAIAKDQPIAALDIGSGTGAEAIPLLQTVPSLKILGLDLCGPMHDVFRANAHQAGIEANRYELIEIDLLSEKARDAIRDALICAFGKERFQLITSAFTLHHFEKAEKKEAFRLISDLLENNGIFVMGDLFSYENEAPWLTDTIFEWEVTWIEKNFESAAHERELSGNIQEAIMLRSLKEQWVTHYKQDNKLDGLTTQMQMLREAGFPEVGSPFRYWQVGLLWAKKGRDSQPGVNSASNNPVIRS